MHVAIDRAGLPTIVGGDNGGLLLTTYALDGTWREERIGPSAGYRLTNPAFPTAEGASNRNGALVVAWRETPVADASDRTASTRTVARVRLPGETVGPPYSLTDESESDCWYSSTCITLGMAADGDVSAVYASLPDHETDLWFSRRDASTGAWSSPRQLATGINRYIAEWAHSTAWSGRSVVAIPDETGHLVYRCRAGGDCGSGTLLMRPATNRNVYVDGAGRRAALLWGLGCGRLDCWQRDLRARVFE